MAQNKVKYKVIAIGGSAGSLDTILNIIANSFLNNNIFYIVVLHRKSDNDSLLAGLFSSRTKFKVKEVEDKDSISPGYIYIAPPDYHMLIQDGRIRITRGPKENRFRPAVDPLFRSAAYSYGNRVIGVILSGALDDGTAGLWTVKHYGGIAIVQNPMDAEVPSMPENAIRVVNIDHSVGVPELPALLVRLSKEPVSENVNVMQDEQTKREIEIAAEESALQKNILSFGVLSPFTCPECHGVLSRLQNDNIIRYRCHTGHAYTVDALMAALTEKIEDSLYNAIRAMDESVMLLNHLGDHYAEANQPKLAALYFKTAKEAYERSQPVRKTVLFHGQVNKESMHEQVQKENQQIQE